MKKYYGLLIVFISLFWCYSVNAYCVRDTLSCTSGDFVVQKGGTLKYGGDGHAYMIRQTSGNPVFCIKKGDSAPVYGSNNVWNYSSFLCDGSKTLSNALKAAIGYTIHYYYSDYNRDNHNTDTWKKKYYDASQVIHKILNVKNSGTAPTGTMSNGTAITNSTAYKNAITYYNLYNSPPSPTVTLGNFTLNGNNYEATITTDNKGLGSPTLSVNVGSISNGKVLIPKNTSTTNGTVSVTVTASWSKTTYLAQVKDCGSGYQPVAEVTTTSSSKSFSDTDTKSLTISGSFKLKKVNTNNDDLHGLSVGTKAKFALYANENCSGTATKTCDIEGDATCTFSKLTPGKYSIKETKAPTGYQLDSTCRKITVEAGEPNISTGKNYLEVTNQSVCASRFYNGMTMKERIDLYNDIKSAYAQDFNALLDMGNTTDATACKNIPMSKSYSRSCLNASSSRTSSSSFSNTNVSMYTEKYGTYTFCLTTYSLTNKLGKTTFNDIKTGQAILLTDDIVAQGVLKRVCHNFGDNNSVIPTLNYSDYVSSDAKIDNANLVKTETPSGTVTNKTITANYTLPVMYASNKDGKVYYGYCPSGEYCKTIGRGIISKFNLSPGTYNLGFNIELNDSKFGSTSSSSDCKYSVENELIDYNSDVDLEFRIVKTDTDSAFLNKTGNGERKPGANWSDEDVRVTVLKENNNSYNKNNATEAKYSIVLTPKAIEQIRIDNKNKSYDNYDFTCKNEGQICISNYLTKLKNNYNLKINGSSKRTCVESKKSEC